MRLAHHRRHDGRAQRAGLRRTGDFHRPARHVGVNLHDQRTFVGDAAAVDDLLHFHPVFLETVDDGQRPKSGRFDQGAVDFRRRRVKRLADEQPGEELVHQDGAVAVVPVQGEQAGFAGGEFGGPGGKGLVRAGLRCRRV